MPYKDKEKQKEFQRKWVAKRRYEFFKDKTCTVCGSDKELQLDHVDPNTKSSHKIWSWKEDKRNNELEKCQILCIACHKKKTYTQTYVLKVKKVNCCPPK